MTLYCLQGNPKISRFVVDLLNLSHPNLRYYEISLQENLARKKSNRQDLILNGLKIESFC